ncbi:hypothetical protein DFH09DRAFT_1372341 [Mycena vulgaris]|nr:hypothetical protein DFH09DRAFT_1372341 [Mycena vulgaris]
MSASPPALDGTLGAMEIGTAVATFLFGILTLQTFNYYREFSKDSILIKGTIGIIWLFELGHTICSLHAIYWITVTTYSRPPNSFIVKPPQSLIVSLLFSAGIDAVVQLFFGNRIRVLSGRSHVFFLCIAMAALRFICDITLMSTIWVFNAGFTVLESKVHWVMITASTVGPAADIVIALAMCYYLWELRESGLRFTRTRTMVDTLMIWTVETTLVTGVAGIMQLILFLTRTDLAFMFFYLIQPKLFSNSMLAVLNGRSRFRSAEQVNLVSGSFFDSAGTRNRRDDGTLSNMIAPTSGAHGVVLQMAPILEKADSLPKPKHDGSAQYAV